MGEYATNLSVVQIRKICDYLSKAAWHAGRRNMTQAAAEMDLAHQVLIGVKRPVRKNAIRELHDYLTDRVKILNNDINHYKKLQALGFEALRHVEESLYEKRGGHEPTPAA